VNVHSTPVWPAAGSGDRSRSTRAATRGSVGAGEGPPPHCRTASLLPQLAADGSAREVGPTVDVDVVVLRVLDDVQE
jgi:hypothetical protein